MTDASMHNRRASYTPGIFAAKLAGTEPQTLKTLAEEAVAAARALTELNRAEAPLASEAALCAAEWRYEKARDQLRAHLLSRYGIGSVLAGELTGLSL